MANTFGERLAEARRDKGWSRSELASRVSVGYNTVWNWEAGKVLPSRQNVERLAYTLEVRWAWLNLGSGQKTSAEAERVHLEKVQSTGTRYSASDKRKLEDIELVIKHLKELNISEDEKKAVHLTLSELRGDYERKVLFGE